MFCICRLALVVETLDLRLTTVPRLNAFRRIGWLFGTFTFAIGLCEESTVVFAFEVTFGSLKMLNSKAPCECHVLHYKVIDVRCRMTYDHRRVRVQSIFYVVYCHISIFWAYRMNYHVKCLLIENYAEMIVFDHISNVEPIWPREKRECGFGCANYSSIRR